MCACMCFVCVLCMWMHVYACVCACVFVLGEAHCGGILMCDMCLYLILNALYSLSLLHCTVPTVLTALYSHSVFYVG
jgi:hypothetical protein